MQKRLTRQGVYSDGFLRSHTIVEAYLPFGPATRSISVDGDDGEWNKGELASLMVEQVR
jgi:hypothetical protein